MKRFLSALVILAVWPVVALHGQEAKKRLTVELLSQEGTLVSPGVRRVEWRPGTHEISYVRRKGAGKGAATTLWLYDIETQKERPLLSGTGDNEKLSLGSYQWSPQGDALLLQGEHDLWLFDVQSGQLRHLTEDPEEKEVATFSPTGDRIAFVKQNNLFVLELKTGSTRKLTEDGSEDVLNGKFDWVYEEELAFRAAGGAYEWSPDGRKIAYLRLDDRPVPQYPLTGYLQVHAGLFRQRFPQPGDANPLPSLHVVSVEGGEHQTWSPSAKPPEYFGPTFSWTPDSSAVSFLTLNRAQNELTVHLWEPAAGSERALLVEKDPYWINSLVPPRFLEGGQRFLWLSERDGWLHLYLYNRSGELLQQLTRGNWQIERPTFSSAPILGIDEKGGWIYFSATEKDPRERQLYRVRTDGGGFARLTNEAGTHTLDLSPDGRFLLDGFSNIDTPPQNRVLRADGSPVATLEIPQNHLGEFALARTEFVEVKAADGATLYARLVKPADFDPARKYPVIVSVYGGPDVQIVQNRWGVTNPFDHLLAEEGFLVWSLDNRGSAGRGHAWESAVFKDLGHRELEDQLAGVAYLKSLPFVDPNHLGIWGWSYGGYMTLYALTHAPEVFKCGAAGGPVTDWKLYDSIYTERYMRTPPENPEGYKSSSNLEAAGRLKARVLLIHGTDDDNVHMQNTMEFINALIDARRPFELYLQPGQKHGFSGQTARTYLDERLLDFFKTNLSP